MDNEVRVYFNDDKSIEITKFGKISIVGNAHLAACNYIKAIRDNLELLDWTDHQDDDPLLDFRIWLTERSIMSMMFGAYTPKEAKEFIDELKKRAS